MEKKLVFYQSAWGKSPFSKGLGKLKNRNARAMINARLDRVSLGNLQEGVFELRIDYGPGFRIYFSELNGTVVLLLLGGKKNTQSKDISKALKYWKSFKERYNDE